MTGKLRNLSVPAYKVIQCDIQRHIASSNLKPGDVVPSERELSKTYNVSLMTARHALSNLGAEGIVERRRGVGTFVAAPKIHFNKLMSYSEQMLSRGLTPSSRVLGVSIVEGSPEIVARLGRPSDSQLLMIHRLRLGGSEPLAVETCYLHASDFPGLETIALGTNSLFCIIEKDYATKLTYADEEIDATVADLAVGKIFHVAEGSPVLRIRQTIYTAQGNAAIYVIGIYRSERHSLFIRRYR